MSRAFKLPDLGEGVHEGEVLAVHVTAGQAVNEGDIILEVETDKAAVEIPSPFTGTVAEVLVKAGDTVRVGDLMMTFSNGDEKRAQEGEAAAEVPLAAAITDADPAGKERPVPASPATRRLAREMGVELAFPTRTIHLARPGDDERTAGPERPTRDDAAAEAEPDSETAWPRR